MESAPTGCYKCGRPGYWSRNCPFYTDNSSSHNPSSAGGGGGNGGGSGPASSRFFPQKAADNKPKKVPRTRPKHTPELLLSDDGLGYVLRYFPRAFKYRGGGNEVRDLGNLLELYSEWHSRLLPYYSFNQFIHKVEQVGSTKRVKTCLRELRERIANGGYPTKLSEPPVVDDIPADKPEAGEESHQQGDMFSEYQNAENIQEDMLNEIYDKGTSEPSQNVNGASTGFIENTSNGVSNGGANLSVKADITEEQRARMEANRLKAIERRADITEEQRARVEANRLKALERCAARASMAASTISPAVEVQPLHDQALPPSPKAKE